MWQGENDPHRERAQIRALEVAICFEWVAAGVRKNTYNILDKMLLDKLSVVYTMRHSSNIHLERVACYKAGTNGSGKKS